MLSDLISPVATIAALGMIESLLCGASAARMKSEPFHADQELIAQGVGNIDRKSTRLNSSHLARSRMPSSA